MTFALLAAALAVLPSDRMAMADRMFNRGDWKGAKAEYASLQGEKGIEADELLYRLAECERLAGNSAAARAAYKKLLDAHPLSRHVGRARLMMALSAPDDATKKSELRLLDSDRVKASVRASALYHYAQLASDRDAFAKCVEVEPDGPYALYAKFHGAALGAEDKDPAVRRKAIDALLDISKSKKDETLAREALYLAASRCYAAKKYDEASALFRRYLKRHPGDKRCGVARTMAVWSDYLAGKYADAAGLCGDGGTDDTAYLLAACAYASGDRAKAKALIERYLADYPNGRYRKSVELPLARMEFEAADKAGNTAGIVEAARRTVSLSGASQDRLRLAWAYEKAGDDKEALKTYLAVARENPGTDDAAEALYRKAMMDIRAGRWSPAELALKEALETGRNERRRPLALYWRGIASVRLGYGAAGEKCLREALKLGLPLNETREAKLHIADADYGAGRLEVAKAAYAALVRDGACERMGAKKMHAVGRFLLEGQDGTKSLPAEAKLCAEALAKAGKSPEWRQAAFTLLGEAEEAMGEMTAAAGSYRQALAEGVRTDDARSASLRLGILESKAGEHKIAEKTLKEAVALNASDDAMRAEAYLWLARNAEAAGLAREACSYATVVVTLFQAPALVDEAKKILAAHPEENE